MEHIDVSNQSLAAQEAEINLFVIRTTDLKDPVQIQATRFKKTRFKQLDSTKLKQNFDFIIS